jgi:phospholipid transport system substrate-binding protein
MKVLLASLTCLSALTFSVSSFGQALETDTPDGLMKAVTMQVLDQIKTDNQIQNGSVTRITQLVNEKILPYADFQRTTRLAMARNWNLASPQQQRQIVDQFKTLLIRTYAGALAQVTNHQIEYQPFRAPSDATDVVVRSIVVHNNSRLELDYRAVQDAPGLARL